MSRIKRAFLVQRLLVLMMSLAFQPQRGVHRLYQLRPACRIGRHVVFVFSANSTIDNGGRPSGVASVKQHRSVYKRALEDRKRGRRFPLDNCRTIDDILDLAIERIDDHLPTAAIWSRIFRLLSSGQARYHRRKSHLRVQNEHVQELEQQINIILRHTVNSIDNPRPIEVTTLILSMAKIVKNIQEAHKRRRCNIYHHVLGDAFLLKNNSIPNKRIFHALAKVADKYMPLLDSRCISNLAYAYGLLKYNPRIDGNRTLMDTIAEKSYGGINQFNAQDISNMMWAHATLQISNTLLFQCVGDAVVGMPTLKEFKPQALSNTVWAYASLNIQHHSLFKKVGDTIVAMDDLDEFKSQEIANVMWAYAKMNAQHPDLFLKVGDAIVGLDNLVYFKPQELNNIAWSFATVNIQHTGVFEAIGDHIVTLDNLSLFKAQELANIVWAYATAAMKHPDLFKKIGDGIVEQHDLDSFSPHTLSNIAWSYAAANESHTILFNAVADTVAKMEDLTVFKPQELTNILWAYTIVDIEHQDLFKALGDGIVSSKDMCSSNQQEMSSTV